MRTDSYWVHAGNKNGGLFNFGPFYVVVFFWGGGVFVFMLFLCVFCMYIIFNFSLSIFVINCF